MSARLVSLNVGMPRDITWRGKTVHTGIWKNPVQGRLMVRRLNIDGDGQGDLSGHGGSNRPVMVYQLDSYCYWERELRRTDLSYGQFGENFTVDGLQDGEVCIGDRYRIGVGYSRPLPNDRQGTEFDAPGRITVDVLEKLGVPRDADFYLCGPASFLQDLTAGLAAWGVTNDHIHSEAFGPGKAITPGIADSPNPPPHPPPGPAASGPSVSFARSGLNVPWDPKFPSLLDFAEACDVPVRWSCRTGVCHICESGLISGTVSYQPEPLDPAAQGNVLICCSQPQGDLVLDL